MEPIRRAEMTIWVSEFEVPPMQDLLLVGKRAPIGPEAVRRMVEAISPQQYEIIRLDHDIFEAVVLKKSLLKLFPQEKLLPIVLEEGARIATENTVLKAQVKVVIQVNGTVNL